MLLDQTRSALLIIDVQDRLMPAMADRDDVVANIVILMRAAHRMAVPILLSRQYPKGLGDVVEPVRDAAGDALVYDKLAFSCFADESLRHAMRDMGRDQFVVAGVEAHVCVLQSAADLISEGYQTAVVADAVSSRRAASKQTALARLAQHNADIVTAEMVLFEWLREAGGEAFKELSALIR
ncbi:MAG: hydrolase [Pseudomonadota bacterium]